jgi:hypothetical protein
MVTIVGFGKLKSDIIDHMVTEGLFTNQLDNMAAEIVGDLYSKKSPLPRIGDFPCLANSPMLSSYEFSQPPESYKKTCTSFYVFLGLRWLTGLVGYWTPTQLHHLLSASHCRTPPPQHHYLLHTIGKECTSWFGAIRPLWWAPVSFLNNAKLLIS